MANIYVRSTDGSDADNGSTWALAKATITGAGAVAAAGDTIWMSQAHSESTAGSLFISIPGVLGSVLRILCGNDAAEPPTALAASAVVATAGAAAGGINISSSADVYWYGVTLSTSGSTSMNLSTYASGSCALNVFDTCSFVLAGSISGATLQLTGSAGISGIYRNCTFKFGAAGQTINTGGAGRIIWEGGSLLSGGTSPTNLIGNFAGAAGDFTGLDLSNASSTINLAAISSVAMFRLQFRDCKLPSGWSGCLFNGTINSPISIVSMFNCDAGSVNYGLWVEQRFGSVKSETTLVRTGGASDGTTPLSWKVTTSADARFTGGPLALPEIHVWNDTTGAAKTVTVEILHDSATNLKDDEIWVEVQYLGSSGAPLSTLITDAKADVLATAADQTTSSATWTTTGMSNPNKQKLSVTFTPQMKGIFLCAVKMAKPSYTVYVDPVATVS